LAVAEAFTFDHHGSSLAEKLGRIRQVAASRPSFLRSKMRRKLTNRLLVGLATVSFAIFSAAIGAKSQQAVASQTPAAADQVPTQAASGGQLQKITVTGYIVPRVGDGPQPVITLNRDFIQRQGDQTVSDVLQRLPQNAAAFTPSVNAGNTFSPAASEVNLYGLGTNSTLVLIDGKRQTTFPFPQNGFQSFVDLNSIPLAAVDRIEILKDGASSIYGSDAIAGVVNVISKKDYTGGDVNAYYGISGRGDDEVYHVQLSGGLGHSFNENSKLSLTAAFDFYDSSPIDANDRSYSSNVDHSKIGHDVSDLRSFNSPAGNFVGKTTGNLYSVVPGTTGPSITVADLDNPVPNLYNLVPGVQLLPRERRFGTYLTGTYLPFQFLQIYDDFSYQYNQELASYTATPLSSTDFITVPANNPFNPTGEDLDPALRLLEFGQRKTETTITNIRNVVGLRFINLPKNWFVDAWFLYAESDGNKQQTNLISKSGLQEALNGTFPGLEGQFFNPFIDQSAVRNPNPGFENVLKVTANDYARTDLTQWAVQSGGELIDLPAGSITAGFGAEYRSNGYVDVKDAASQAGDIVSQGGKGNASGKDYDRAVYGELTIPILGGKWSFPGARALEFVLSERYDNYSSFSGAWKPKFSFRYKPLDDLTFRASYSEGFRAPAVTELFESQLTSFTPITDPRVPSPPNGNNYVVELITEGNPNLQPETAYAYYAGLVWSPGSADPERSWWGWANGFTAYFDWVEILKHNVISQVDPQFVVNNPGLFPGAVVRDGFGNILSVADPLENLGAVRVDAFDFGGSYVTKEFDWGKLNLALDATYFYHVSQQNVPHGQVLNVTDSLASNFPVNPDFKMVASIFYSKTIFATDTFQTGFTFNYVDSEHDVNDYQALGLTRQQFVAATGLSNTHLVGNWTTIDWQISYELGKGEEVAPQTPQPGYDKDGKRLIGEKATSPKPEGRISGWRRYLQGTRLTFGIQNIGDVRPPFQDSFTGYDPTQANALGRYFYVQIDKKF
jgi:iron complex outermembrane recepter protein